jgi:20S proteasome alpha/beta subunit
MHDRSSIVKGNPYPLKHVVHFPPLIPQLPIRQLVRRLPERKAVTIGIGFACQGGVALAADRQITVEGYFKDHEPKLTVIEHPECRVVSTYAYLPSLANLLNSKVDLELKTIAKPYGEEILQIITAETAKLKKQYPSEMKRQQFLWAISTHGEAARLIKISGGIIDEPQWACIGIGDTSVVRYCVSQITAIPPTYLPVDEGSKLAVYIVKQAKTFVDGCGGETDAAIVYDDVDENPIKKLETEEIEKDFGSLQFAFQYLYNIWTNALISENERKRLMSDLAKFVKDKRSEK